MDAITAKTTMGSSISFVIVWKNNDGARAGGFPLHNGPLGIRVRQAEAVVAGLGMQALIEAGIKLKVAYPQIGGLHQPDGGFELGRAELGKVNLPAELHG